MSIDTILFDLDGTLVDTAPDLAYALNTLLHECGFAEKPYNEIKPLVSFGGKALIKFGFDCDEAHPDFNNRHKRILEIYTDNINRFSKQFSGVDALIKRIESNKIKWGVVTNKTESLTNLLLTKLKMSPKVVVCGDTLEFCKPHPMPLLYACTQLNTKPERCLFVGDAKNDMLAGKNAHIKTVAVGYGYGVVEKNWQYDYLIHRPEQLLELL